MIPNPNRAPSVGAFEAAERAYLEGGQNWVNKQLLEIHRRDRQLGRELVVLAALVDDDGTNPEDAFLAAIALWHNASEREQTGAQLDQALSFTPINN